MVLGYLAAAVLAVAIPRAGADRWLVVHLLLLGAATNAIVIWTGHFTTTLLRTKGQAGRTTGRRLAGLNLAVVLVLTGVTTGRDAITIVGAVLLAAVILAHLIVQVRGVRQGMGGRFVPVVRFYWAAAVALLAGVAAGALLAVGPPAGWYPRLYAAHVCLNVFGWVALTVLGTELPLWPMVLRTQLVDGMARAARWASAACATGLALTVAGILLDLRPVAAAGLAGYLAGVAAALDPFVRTAWRRPPRGPAAWLLAAGTCWLTAALAVNLAAMLRPGAPAGVSGRLAGVVPWLLAGFVAQVLAGALTYLLPVVLGRGPSGGRRAAALLDRWGAARTITLNAGVVLIALPLPGPVGIAGWALTLAALATFLVLAAVLVAPVLVSGHRDAHPSR